MCQTSGRWEGYVKNCMTSGTAEVQKANSEGMNPHPEARNENVGNPLNQEADLVSVCADLK